MAAAFDRDGSAQVGENGDRVKSAAPHCANLADQVRQNSTLDD
jgi:hypothetical protein